MSNVEPNNDQCILRVQFIDMPDGAAAPFECIVDIADGLWGQTVVGVEVLGFGQQVSAELACRDAPQDIRCSYDPEIDALYVHVRRGTARIQRKAAGVAFVDRGIVTAIEVRICQE